MNVGIHLNSSEKVPMHAGHLLTAFPSLSAPTYPLKYTYIKSNTLSVFTKFLRVHVSKCMKQFNIHSYKSATTYSKLCNIAKSGQRLKTTCNCTHEFHFPPEFSIIYCQSTNSLKETFPNSVTLELCSQHSNRELLQPPAIFNPLVFTKRSTFSSQNS